jgi:hypothetical protein
MRNNPHSRTKQPERQKEEAREHETPPLEIHISRDWSDHATIIISAITLIVVAFYTYYAGSQLKIMQGQLKQMETANRPWVGLDEQAGLQASSIVFDGDGQARVDYVITAKNFSSFVANNVFSRAELMITQDLATIDTRQKMVCAEVTQNLGLGFALFPGADRHINKWPSFVKKSEIIWNTKAVPPQKDLTAMLVGCTGYRDSAGIAHHTGFIFAFNATRGNEYGGFHIMPNVVIDGVWRLWRSAAVD